MGTFKPTAAQAAAIAHRGTPLLLSAGAGSGKTRVLVERLLDRILRDGLDVDRFLIITYTRAAAAELRERIRDALQELLRQEPGNARLRRQALLCAGAQIGTIHAFCGGVIRENAARCGIRPDFRQLDPQEEAVLRQSVLTRLVEERYAALTPEFRELADTLGAGRDDSALLAVALETYDAVQSHPDPEAWLTEQLAAPVFDGDAEQTPWGSLLLREGERITAYWIGRLEGALRLLENEERLGPAYSPAFRGALASLQRFRAALGSGWDGAAAFSGLEFPRLGSYKGILEHPRVPELKALWEELKKRMRALEERFRYSSQDLREDCQAVKPVTDGLLALVLDFSRAYFAEKQRRGVLDFSDLEHLCLRLLTEADGSPTPLAEEIAQRYGEILVDEYQDCNRVQDRIFRAVSRGGQNITMVGDVKQSIYRFRLADPHIFLEKYAAYRDEAAAGSGRRILLSENFRSRPGVLEAVNQTFENLMSPSLGEMTYGERERLRPGLPEAGEGAALQLFVPEYGDGDRLTAEAEAVADYIASLLRAELPVAGRPIRPDDVAILLRASKGRDSVFRQALERRGIPAVCLKAADELRTRPAAGWAMSLLQIIDNPRQDIPLLAVLRSPIWHMTEERLGQLRGRTKAGDLYDALLAAEEEPDAAGILAQLRRWRELGQRLPADRLLESLYGELELPALAEAAEPGASAELEVLAEAARRFAQAGAGELYGFVTRLQEAEALNRSLTTAPGGGGGVTITTIHASKGLEYPVVVLADLMHQFNNRDLNAPLLIHPTLGVGVRRSDLRRGIRYTTLPRMAIARQKKSEALSEELRVLYVAMTRPQQRLALFLGVKDREAARAALKSDTLPLPPELLEEVKSTGEWLLRLSLALEERGPWRWLLPPAPGAVPLTAAPEETADPARTAVVRQRLAREYAYEADTRLPSKVTATALRDTFAAAEAGEGAAELRVPRVRRRDFRPPAFLQEAAALTPAERGTAIHLAMQYAELRLCGTPEGAAEALRQLEAKRLLTPAELAAVPAEKLHRFAISPLGQAFLTPEAHREFKFSLLTPAADLLGAGDGEVLLQGVIDCWVETPEGLWLLDYKSDQVRRETAEARAREYAPQLRAYALALTRITGKPVTKCCLWFFAIDDGVQLTADGERLMTGDG